MQVHSIFNSISGECGDIPQGAWVTFIRLDGCNLRCRYCDTVVTQVGNHHRELTVEDVFEEVELLCSSKRVVITGGEPLLQEKELIRLTARLKEWGAFIQVETNGSLVPSIPQLDLVDCWVVDFKTYGSGMTHEMLWPKDLLKFPDGSFLKFVITDKNDYRQAVRQLVMVQEIQSPRQFRFAFSACPPLNHATLFEWMLKDSIPALFNVQIHKLTHLNENC